MLPAVRTLPPVGGYQQYQSFSQIQNTARSRGYTRPITQQAPTNFGYNKPVQAPENMLLKTLDKNRDGELSKAELRLAFQSLSKLDSDSDGKLSKTEIYPEPYHVKMAREVRQRATRIANGKPSPKAEYVNLEVARVMRFDKNKDGLVSQTEFPERMQTFLQREDTNGDNSIDLVEANAIADRRWQGLSSPKIQSTVPSETQEIISQNLPGQWR